MCGLVTNPRIMFLSGPNWMPDLPRLGAATYLADLTRIPGLRAWIDGRDVEIRDFTELSALDSARQSALVTWVRQEFSNHSGRLGMHGPYLGLTLDQPDPDLRALVQRRFLTALAALEQMTTPDQQPHMVLHSPFTTWSGFNRGTEMDDQKGILDRTLQTLEPIVKRAEDTGVTLVIENCEDRDPWERVTLAAAFNSAAVRVSLDTGHAHYAHGSTGAPPVDAYVRAAGAALAHVHVQDADGISDRHWPAGRGSIHWHAVFRALAELPEMPRLIIEMARGEDILACAKYLADQGLAV